MLEGRLPGEAKGSWIVTARRTYYDLVANSLVDTELPAFGDLQGRLDWNLGRDTRLTFFGLLSREATDAFFEDDRPGEQLTLATTARNDLGALELTTRLGSSLQSRTIASFYLNRDEIDAAAQLRNEARRSNAPSDEVGFGLADVDFTRELQVRDLALRQELALAKGSHLVESGFELHQLRTGTLWRIAGDRNPTADNGSSIQGGAGLPSDLDSSVDATRVGAWLVDRWQASPRVSLEAGLRFDWSGVNRRATLSPRLAATWRLGGATRLRAGGGLFTQSPGYEKLDPVRLLRGPVGRARALARLRAGRARRARRGARSRARVERAGGRLLEGPRRPDHRSPRDRGGAARARRAVRLPGGARLEHSRVSHHHELPRERRGRTVVGLRRAGAEAADARREAHRLGVLHLGPRQPGRVRPERAFRLRPAARGEPRGVVALQPEVGARRHGARVLRLSEDAGPRAARGARRRRRTGGSSRRSTPRAATSTRPTAGTSRTSTARACPRSSAWTCACPGSPAARPGAGSSTWT